MLWPADGTSLGYLDLVLHVLDAQQRTSVRVTWSPVRKAAAHSASGRSFPRRDHWLAGPVVAPTTVSSAT